MFQAEHFNMGQLLTLISKLVLPISPFHALYGSHYLRHNTIIMISLFNLYEAALSLGFEKGEMGTCLMFAVWVTVRQNIEHKLLRSCCRNWHLKTSFKKIQCSKYYIEDAKFTRNRNQIRSQNGKKKKGIIAGTSFGAFAYSIRTCLKGIARKTVFPSYSKTKLN